MLPKSKNTRQSSVAKSQAELESNGHNQSIVGHRFPLGGGRNMEGKGNNRGGGNIPSGSIPRDNISGSNIQRGGDESQQLTLL